jgi:hypothetical protein
LLPKGFRQTRDHTIRQLVGVQPLNTASRIKSMKVHPLFLLAAVTTCGLPAAFGFADFARGELVLNTTARAAYDSRVLGSLSDSSDYIYTLTPQLIFRRQAGEIKLDAMVGTRINRYQEFTELNSEDFLASVKFLLPPSSLTLASGSFETTYDEHNDVNYDVNRRVREKSFMTHLDALLPMGLKMALLLDGSFRRDQRIHFSDQETRSGSVGFRYMNFLGGTTFDLRYRRLETETSGENAWNIPLDQHSDIYLATLSRPIFHDVRGSITYGYRVLHRSAAETFGTGYDKGGSILMVDLVGPFLSRTAFPNLESSLSLGYQKADAPGINERGGNRFIGNMRLAWHPRDRTRLFVEARRTTELAITDTTVDTTSGNIGIRQEVGDFTTVTLSGGYEHRDYKTLGRADDVWIGDASVYYKITRSWSAEGTLRVRTADSDLATANYSREIVSLSATYTF